MKTWPEIIQHLIDRCDFTRTELAAHLGVSQGAVEHWLAGRREPGVSLARKLYWLSNGEERIAIVDVTFPYKEPTQ